MNLVDEIRGCVASLRQGVESKDVCRRFEAHVKEVRRLLVIGERTEGCKSSRAGILDEIGQHLEKDIKDNLAIKPQDSFAGSEDPS